MTFNRTIRRFGGTPTRNTVHSGGTDLTYRVTDRYGNTAEDVFNFVVSGGFEFYVAFTDISVAGADRSQGRTHTGVPKACDGSGTIRYTLVGAGGQPASEIFIGSSKRGSKALTAKAKAKAKSQQPKAKSQKPKAKSQQSKANSQKPTVNSQQQKSKAKIKSNSKVNSPPTKSGKMRHDLIHPLRRGEQKNHRHHHQKCRQTWQAMAEAD